MKFESIKEKCKSLYSKIGRKNLVIVGVVLLIATAIIVNVAVFSTADGDGGFDYDQSAGASGNNGTTAQTTSPNSVDTYFSSVQISRQRTRDEAIEVLQSVIENQASTESAKNEALIEMNKLAAIMEDEANIETLIMGKGFEECVAVISGDKISIVVKSDGLIPSQISQINEIVYEQAGIKPVGITIIER